MKNKELKNELAKLIDEIDDWEAEMEIQGMQFIPAFIYLNISIETLKQLRAKGLVTYTVNYQQFGGEVDTVSITPKGYTYIEDEKSERNKWLIRIVIVGAITSIIVSGFTTLVVQWLTQR